MKKRQTQTKLKLKNAFTSLLKEKNFENISISDITRRANINRGTFYLHYTDKYDMVEQLKEQTLADLDSILNDCDIETNIHHVLIETFSYLQHHFDFIEVISNTSFVNFPKTIKDFVYNFLLKFPNYKAVITKHYDVPYPYALEVYLASIESLISYWVSTHGKESPEEMTEIISKVLNIDSEIKQFKNNTN